MYDHGQRLLRAGGFPSGLRAAAYDKAAAIADETDKKVWASRTVGHNEAKTTHESTRTAKLGLAASLRELRIGRRHCSG